MVVGTTLPVAFSIGVNNNKLCFSLGAKAPGVFVFLYSYCIPCLKIPFVNCVFFLFKLWKKLKMCVTIIDGVITLNLNTNFLEVNYEQKIRLFVLRGRRFNA